MISANPAAFKQTRAREYAIRFVFGGLCTAAAGWVAHRFGPEIGGLFLAFPAIFPASACLIESHERRRKAQAGMNGISRGRAAASLDAAGASAGAIALAVFALAVWLGLPRAKPAVVIPAATAIWMFVAWLLWIVRKSRLLHRRRPGT